MKAFLLILAGLFPISLHAQRTLAVELSDAAAKALPAVVRVQSFISDSLLSVRPGLVTLMRVKTRSGTGVLAGSASGVLISATGDLMTNAHVLAGGDSLMVILPDRRVFRAVLVGIDDAADLALLKIKATGLPFMQFGDSDLLRIGDPVLAVGNPLDLTSTVTAGILSARFRSMDDLLNASAVNSYLQTDAASNEGMSGSALVDRSGKLIGINSAILSPTGTFAGYAFAIPSSIVKKSSRELARYGRVRHAGLDMAFSDAKNKQGVSVDSLAAGGAASRAGLRRQDILLNLNQHPLVNAAHLREILAQHSPGDQVWLTIERRGGQLQFPVVLSLDGNGQAISRSSSQKVWPVIRTYQH
jgi:serine protease Do